jgi:hypothetical protein
MLGLHQIRDLILNMRYANSFSAERKHIFQHAACSRGNELARDFAIGWVCASS